MEKVLLIPPALPVPKAISKGPKTKPKKEPSMQEKYKVTNTDNPRDKHPDVQILWDILDKMDPDMDLWSKDIALLSLEGSIVKGRLPKDLGLTPQEAKLIRSVAILDCTEADDKGNSITESAIGSIATIYQLVELAYNLGKSVDASEAVPEVAPDEEEDDEDDEDDEDLDDYNDDDFDDSDDDFNDEEE